MDAQQKIPSKLFVYSPIEYKDEYEEVSELYQMNFSTAKP